MDFELPEELQMLKANLRRFVDTELIPIERETNDGHEFFPGVQEKLEEKARSLGLWLFDVDDRTCEVTALLGRWSGAGDAGWQLEPAERWSWAG